MSHTRIIAASLALSLIGAATPAAHVANYNAFGLSVLQRLPIKSKTENVFISPTSIGIALAMTADGAAGSTRDGILHGLQFKGDDLGDANAALIAALASNSDAMVGVADAIWTRRDVQPRQTYVGLLKSKYGAQAQALDFDKPSAAATINAWIKAHTLDLIDHLLDKTSPGAFAYLTNAVAFKAKWSSPFDKDHTVPKPFIDADGSRHNVSMMSQTARFATADNARYRVLRLPYGKGGYAAYVILPPSGGLDAVVKQLTAAELEMIARSVRPERLDVSLPRLTMTYDASLRSTLQALGMSQAFSGAADFSPMHAGLPKPKIDDVFHATYLRVDEEGTTAAAATIVHMGMTAIEQPPKRFVVDHPFVLAIREESTGTILFIGVIRHIPPA